MIKKKNKLLLTAFILTTIHLVLTILVAIALGFNLFGIVDVLNNAYMSMGMQVAVSDMLMSYYFDFVFVVIINFLCVKRYWLCYKYNANTPSHGRSIVFNAIMQLLFSTYIPGIVALIAGIKMQKAKPIQSQEQQQQLINEIKFEAMSEAVARLKELRASGAISEEEYYANLNKILES